MTSPNKYSFCHADGRLEHFAIPAELARIFADYEYITLIAEEIDKELPAAGLHVVTTWAGNSVLKLDPNCTILIVVGDERAQVPNGAGTVRLAFRTGAPKTPWPVVQISQRPFSLFLLSTVREFKNLGSRVNRWVKNDAPLLTPANVESIPIGFVGNIKLSPEKMSLRKWDLSFAGSVGEHFSFGKQRLPLRPKAAARLAMLQGVEELSTVAPDLPMRVVCSDLESQTALAKSEYQHLLQQTKISLCARGNFVETFRLFESACLGCVIFTDPLPKSWYFENHPFIEVQDWRKFAPMALALIKDHEELERLGSLSRRWWEQVASPQSVARQIAERIQRAWILRAEKSRFD